MTQVQVGLGRESDMHPYDVVLVVGEGEKGAIAQLTVDETKDLIVHLQEKVLIAQHRNRERPKMRMVNGSGEGNNLRDDAQAEHHLCAV